MPIRAAFSLVCLLFGVTASASSPDDPAWTRADPEAKTRFEQTSEAYKALASYEDRGSFHRTLRLAGRERVENSPLSLKVTRPAKIALDAGEVRLLGDGKTLTTVLVPTKRYLTTPSTGLDATTIADGPAGAVLLGGATGPPSQLLLNLLLGGPPAAALPDRATSLKNEPDKTIDGTTYHALRVELGDEPPLRVLIDSKTHLIRRMEYILDATSTADRLPKSVGEVGDMAIAWDSGPIATDPIPAEAFAFKAPAGFERLRAAEAAKPAAKGKNELLGKLAPEFTLTLLDGAGKTRKATRADLAGKVVVLDFWATWCGPCLQELPEIQKLAEAYAKSNPAGVVVIAVSQDRAPEDGSSVRGLVEALLKTKELNLARGPVSRVALDPNQDVGDAFKVEALPTVVLLDTKGIVQFVQVGFSDEVKDVLTTAIDSLLEGKALVQPGGEPEGGKKAR